MWDLIWERWLEFRGWMDFLLLVGCRGRKWYLFFEFFGGMVVD